MKNHPVWGQMEIAEERCVSRYPLLGALVSRWTLRDRGTDTVAVGMSDHGFNLYFNPNFVQTLTIEQTVGVLHHEVRHLVFGHLLLDPEDYPDQEALTIAAEVTVNENLPEPLPKGVLLLKDFPSLPPDEDTEKRYARLAKRRPRRSRRASDPTKNESIPNYGQGGAGDRKHEGVKGPKGAGKTPLPTPDGKGKESESQKNGSASCSLDDHDHWHEVRERESLARDILEDAVHEFLSERRDLTDYERAIIEHVCKQCGHAPAELFSDLQLPDAAQKVPWQVLLRRYIGRDLARSPSYMRPPRRFPHLLGLVPGTIRAASRPKICAVIDTSGSMSDPQLAEISKEMSFLSRDRDIHIVECDAVVHRVYRYQTPITRMHGRGGTDFRPPLEPAFLSKHRPDLVVFFTDGFGPAPKEPPRVPVIWVLTSDGEKPVDWGRSVKMAEKRNPGD